MVRKFFCPIRQHRHIICHILDIIQFGIWAIIIGLVVDRAACFNYKGLDVSALIFS